MNLLLMDDSYKASSLRVYTGKYLPCSEFNILKNRGWFPLLELLIPDKQIQLQFSEVSPVPANTSEPLERQCLLPTAPSVLYN
ncbi:hypothetical protein SLEP1_g14658 [Rubroshorea leprosula]|uniref:Uncharacterized protein n=1 Tax=Rubroshorea leprosula TaxID=152421 RepID=A0AAV5IJT0_9ROSI|nr:hypothetical protein SLEP1_g14658 [Rubroshorea leprosula]